MNEKKEKLIAEIKSMLYPSEPEDAITIQDYQEAMGITHEGARRALNRLVREGKLTSMRINGKTYYAIRKEGAS